MSIGVLAEALSNVLSPVTLFWMAFGILIGVVFGAVPGLSGNLGIILFLPFTRDMPLANAVIFLTCIFCGGEFGGSISAILIGTPGTNSATCTMLEGYPLAKAGHAKKALTMALISSCTGGILSALVLLLFAPVMAKYTLRFGPPEYFAIAVFGLSIIASLSGKSLLKGLFSGAVGIMLSLVGIDAVSGMTRFTFGNIMLYNGITLISLLTGMFAFGSILEKVGQVFQKNVKRENVSIDKKEKITCSEVWGLKKTLLKSSLLGIFVGAVPGAGTGIASFISYNEAKRTSKHPEEYGKGSYEGIAAVESANNGVTAASLIPLLTLGLPGSPSAAVLIGAFTMKGLSVGPMLFRENGVIMYTIMMGVLLANIFMFLEGNYLSGALAKITRIPNEVMAPLLMIVCGAGVMSINNSPFDLLTFLVAGTTAYLFQKLNVPMVPAVLGFVLGSMMDSNLRKALVMTHGSFLNILKRPISGTILLLTVLVLGLTVIKEFKQGKSKMNGVIQHGKDD